MKSFIYFNSPDVPEGMGQSQLADNLQEFIDTHTEQLPNAVLQGNLLVFDKNSFDEFGELLSTTGYAVVSDVPDTFQN